MGEVHGEAYATLRDEARVFYVDNDPEQAAAYAERFGGAGVFRSIKAAVMAREIDAVDICLPPQSHAAATEMAFGGGKHVLVEKPMATTLVDADRMIQAGRRAGKVLAVAENFRFMPHLNRARQMIADGALGDLFLIEVNLFESLRPLSTPQGQPGVGALMDVGHHFVDMAVQLGGPVAWVFAQFAQRTYSQRVPGYPGEDTAVIMLGYASGTIGQMTITIGAPGAPPRPTFIVCGTGASLFFDWQSGLWTGDGRAWTPATLVRGKAPEAPDSFEYWGETIHAGVRAFVHNLRAGLAPEVAGAIGRYDLEIILAAQQSARTLQRVAVERPPGVGAVAGY